MDLAIYLSIHRSTVAIRFPCYRVLSNSLTIVRIVLSEILRVRVRVIVRVRMFVPSLTLPYSTQVLHHDRDRKKKEEYVTELVNLHEVVQARSRSQIQTRHDISHNEEDTCIHCRHSLVPTEYMKINDESGSPHFLFEKVIVCKWCLFSLCYHCSAGQG